MDGNDARGIGSCKGEVEEMNKILKKTTARVALGNQSGYRGNGGADRFEKVQWSISQSAISTCRQVVAQDSGNGTTSW